MAASLGSFHACTAVALLPIAMGGFLAQPDCPEQPAAYIHPSVTHGSPGWTGVYRAPWEFVCGRPLTVRVQQAGEVLTATVDDPGGCPRHGEVRWTGGVAPGARGFEVRSRTWSGTTSSWREGTGMLVDRCTIELDVGGAGRTRFSRVDPQCPGGTGAIVVFVGGLWDGWNRNLLKVYCAYDAEGEGTRKLYFAHNDDLESMRDRIARARAERAAPVVLVGHSYGAATAHRVADSLGVAGGIDLLVTLDPVSGRWERRAAPRPRTVARWINVRVGSSPGLSSCGLAGAIGGAWGAQTAADLELRFPSDPASDDPDEDHCKTLEMFQLDAVMTAVAGVS